MIFNALFQCRSPALLGVDIGSSGVKLVELGRDRSGQFRLERCALEPLGEGWVVDGQIEKFDEVAQAMRRAVRKSGARVRDAVLALPAAAVITRKIVLPDGLDGLSAQELEAQVQAQARRHIPFPLDEVSMDFCVLGQRTLDAEPAGAVEILMAASRKDKVQERQGLAEAAGLRARILDIETFAARRAATRLLAHWRGDGADRPDALAALFEIGAGVTRLQALRGEEWLYSRDQEGGGAQLTQRIVHQYGLSAEEAEARKRRGDWPEDYAGRVLEPFVAHMAQEVARALQFFYTSTPYDRVDVVLLAGGSAGLPGLAEAVARQAGVACRLADPFDGMAPPADLSALPSRREAPAYLRACGLAMRKFAP